jgi:predicted nucleotidyltransferase
VNSGKPLNCGKEANYDTGRDAALATQSQSRVAKTIQRQPAGITARDKAQPDSDVDILIAFDGPATSKRYFGAQLYLKDLLENPDFWALAD